MPFGRCIEIVLCVAIWEVNSGAFLIMDQLDSDFYVEIFLKVHATNLFENLSGLLICHDRQQVSISDAVD